MQTKFLHTFLIGACVLGNLAPTAAAPSFQVFNDSEYSLTSVRLTICPPRAAADDESTSPPVLSSISAELVNTPPHEVVPGTSVSWEPSKADADALEQIALMAGPEGRAVTVMISAMWNIPPVGNPNLAGAGVSERDGSACVTTWKLHSSDEVSRFLADPIQVRSPMEVAQERMEGLI